MCNLTVCSTAWKANNKETSVHTSLASSDIIRMHWWLVDSLYKWPVIWKEIPRHMTSSCDTKGLNQGHCNVISHWLGASTKWSLQGEHLEVISSIPDAPNRSQAICRDNVTWILCIWNSLGAIDVQSCSFFAFYDVWHQCSTFISV